MSSCGQDYRQDALNVFNAGIQAVLPHKMVKNTLCMEGSTLKVKDNTYNVNHNVHVVAFGKAVIGMVRATEDVLGDHIVDGVASVPAGITEALTKANKLDLLPKEQSHVRIVEGAPDNLPDSAAYQAAQDIQSLAQRLTAEDLLIVLVSGGGSALLPSPVPPITLQEKYQVAKVLGSKGANINELNTIRKNISTLKGGGLAVAAYPAKVITLILSDIIGDLIGLIASGPTIVNDSTHQDCLDIFNKYHASDAIPQSVNNYLKTKDDKLGDTTSDFSHVQNVIVGSNRFAVSAAVSEAENHGYFPAVFSTCINGEAQEVGDLFAHISVLIYYMYEGCDSKSDAFINLLKEKFERHINDILRLKEVIRHAIQANKAIAVITAGETTVTVKGDGKGGRNQELSLAAAISMNAMAEYENIEKKGYNVTLLSGGTDGQDGPTDAAGALAYPSQVTKAREAGLHAEQYLHNNDSYHFYEKFDEGRNLIITGLTGTNVMDLKILLISPPQ
ncbi:glycerate kinase-like [Glandiceps talaboti]